MKTSNTKFTKYQFPEADLVPLAFGFSSNTLKVLHALILFSDRSNYKINLVEMSQRDLSDFLNISIRSVATALKSLTDNYIIKSVNPVIKHVGKEVYYELNPLLYSRNSPENQKKIDPYWYQFNIPSSFLKHYDKLKMQSVNHISVR